MMSPGLGVPDFGMSAAPLDSLFAQAPQIPTQIKPQGGLGGMFGGNGKMFLLAALSGLMARKNPQAAQTIQQAMMMKYRQQMEDQRYQHERQDKRDDFTFEQDYRAAHPGPVNNDTANDYAFWQQHLSPDDFKTYVHNKVDPPQYMQVPGVGIVQIPRAGGMPQGAPTAPVGKLTPLGIGGPSPSGSGGFL